MKLGELLFVVAIIAVLAASLTTKCMPSIGDQFAEVYQARTEYNLAVAERQRQAAEAAEAAAKLQVATGERRILEASAFATKLDALANTTVMVVMAVVLGGGFILMVLAFIARS